MSETPSPQPDPRRVATALAGLAGMSLCAMSTASVVFQSGQPTLASSGGAIIAFLFGAAVTAAATLLPGDASDQRAAWNAWRGRGGS